MQLRENTMPSSPPVENDTNGMTNMPIRDNPAYSQRSSSSLTPSRTSSDNRSSDVASIGELPAQTPTPTPTVVAQAQKRQPRKLTKSRGSGEISVERPKAVLTKKAHTRTSTLSLVEVDGNTGADTTPPQGHGHERRASLVSQGSSNKVG